MPEPARRPTPFMFLLLGSFALKILAAVWLAIGIVQLYVAVRTGAPVKLPDTGKIDWKLIFAYGGSATMLAIQSILIFALGDLCIAVVDMHRDLAVTRERLEKPPAPPPPPRPSAPPPPAAGSTSAGSP
jgi:hypothetical protein